MARARATATEERAPLDVEQDADHRLANFIEVNGVRMRAVFASPREQAECLPVLSRPWNADGRLHPLITRLHTYHAARHTLDVLGYPVVVEFEAPEDARTGLAAYLTEDEINGAPPPVKRTRRAPAAPPPAPVSDGEQRDAFAGEGDAAGQAGTPGQVQDSGDSGAG